jgi:RimJ/RimL family protein N-acetyltransferase
VAEVDPANAASVRVLEKCGFERTGVLDDGRLFYALTANTAR